MNDVKEIEKAFHEARIVGEQLLKDGELSWNDYAEIMLGFESELRGLGEVF